MGRALTAQLICVHLRDSAVSTPHRSKGNSLPAIIVKNKKNSP